MKILTLKFKIIIGVVIFILLMCAYYSAKTIHISSNNDSNTQSIEDTESDIQKEQIGKINYQGKFLTPVENFIKVSSKYGYRTNPVSGKYKLHSGIDLVGNAGSNVLCVQDGEVTWAGWQNGYGNCVEVKHIGEGGKIFYTFYAHMRNNSLKVSKGQNIKTGQILGTQGSTGNSTGDHLHFEIRLADKSTIDPVEYLFEGN